MIDRRSPFFRHTRAHYRREGEAWLFAVLVVVGVAVVVGWLMA